MADAPMSEQELEKFVEVLRTRQSMVEHLLHVAENVCMKLEKGIVVSVTQVEVFRNAIDAANNARLLGS